MAKLPCHPLIRDLVEAMEMIDMELADMGQDLEVFVTAIVGIFHVDVFRIELALEVDTAETIQHAVEAAMITTVVDTVLTEVVIVLIVTETVAAEEVTKHNLVIAMAIAPEAETVVVAVMAELVASGVVGAMEQINKEAGARKALGSLVTRVAGALALLAGATRVTGEDKLTARVAHGVDRDSGAQEAEAVVKVTGVAKDKEATMAGATALVVALGVLAKEAGAAMDINDRLNCVVTMNHVVCLLCRLQLSMHCIHTFYQL